LTYPLHEAPTPPAGHRPRRGWLASGPAIGTAILCSTIVACSSDGSTSTAHYCAAALRAETVEHPHIADDATDDEVVAAVLDFYADRLLPSAIAVEQAAPAGVEDAAHSGVEAIRRKVSEQDPSDFDSSVIDAFARLHEDFVSRCGWNTIDVTAIDFAFDGIPAHLRPGITSFELTNSGSETHQMVIARAKAGVTAPMTELLASADGGRSALTQLSEADAAPGGGGSSVLDLEPGTYAVICFVPVGSIPGTTAVDSAPSHWMQGMVSEFTVS
jgi:hypothetical protein